MCLCSQRQGISRPQIKGLFFTDSVPDNFLQARPNNSATTSEKCSQKSRVVVTSRLLLSAQLQVVVSFFLSGCRSLCLSHCLTLLSDYCEVLKRNQRGICAPLCRSVPVLSVAASSHLILHFCPSRHTHTQSLTHTHTHNLT